MITSRPADQSSIAKADLRNVLICVALFVAAAVAVNPLVEMGMNDDWSYANFERPETWFDGHTIAISFHCCRYS